MTAAPAQEAVTPTLGATFRRARFWIVAAIVAVVIALGSAIVQSTTHASGTFAPDNPGPAGAKALVAVLQQQGVQVTTSGTVADAASHPGTLFVDATDATIPAASWTQLLAGRTRVVVVGPNRTDLEALLPDVRAGGSPKGPTAAASCDLPLARRAGAMDLRGVGTSLRSTDSTACFVSASGDAQLVSGTRDGVRVLLLADRLAFTNEHITGSGNAAVALGALGQTRDLVWFQQTALDPAATGGAKTLQDLTPPWVTPLAVLLLLTGLAAALWKGRRLGPIVVEALPVVVRSRETVEGRARLYNRGAARLHAADALRLGAIRRMVPNLGLARTASVDEVVSAAARLLDRPKERIAAILLTDEPRGDADLVRISDDLARLEAAVRAAVVPGTPSTPSTTRSTETS
ncbi:DUF4350 domain-containing protein [Amnibacterium kyonggiense]|uniref:DUF4350 domain-containing protein n=1 Tax=Amnibacterium kyonggiense TaxID=595671 RepID=A0A4R7FF69_9MICO|nr:DUF4350 domain-containing protein [Amnibacterium kyonggiense]TDS74821.1 hypothetical protein CLV52_3342 [Amnibacterium kyonggiense]